ncbi:hypothetical protein ABGT15_03790 [Flavobacterium enshiense]|uniref:hypothetical protein n=1 Tax=Flavobacterium enshiense TaxID=1341165 RepID=UPI00345D5387
MKKILFFFFLLIYSLHTFAQNNIATVDQLIEQLQGLTRSNSSDIVYLQTSKNIYETEEDVWFKGYVLDGQYFTLSQRSKILFVQLIEDQTDKVVWKKKYEIENGIVSGHLFLKNTLPEGTYSLAGYSANSFFRNSKEFYALKKIKIVKSINQKIIANPIEKDSIIHFTTFPEGGRLVSEIQSTLGFKAVNSKGLPIDVSGTLFENNIPLLQFKSKHSGMGAVIFTPNSNKKYHIQLTEPALVGTFPVGPIDQNGKVLRLLRNSKEDLLFKISQSDALPEEKVYLRLQVRGVVYSMASGILQKNLLIKIPLKDIPQGIAEVTLFNENAVPLAERLVYVNQEQKLTIKTELDKSNYSTRELVNLKIKVTDQTNQGVVAHLGLSVYDGLYQNKQDAKNIQSHFLLTSQLKGTVYNPGYYFDEQNKDREQVLNLLMLTQGWRNYVWDDANVKELVTMQKPVVFDELKGKIQLAKPDKIAANASMQKMIKISAADKNKGVDFIMTDSIGDFTITSNDLKKGEGGFTYIQLMTPPKPKYLMNFKDFSFEEIDRERKTKTLLYPLQGSEKADSKEISPFADRVVINKLDEVLISSKRKKTVFRDKYIGKLDSLARAELQAPNDDYVCINNIFNCPNHVNAPGNSLPVVGHEYIRNKPYPIGGYKNANSRHPVFTEAELLNRFNIAMVEGYYGKKVFYEAVYDNVTINDPIPDYRNTLFWKPDIITNEQGEAKITFFCSDINSLFLGNIEGVSGDGLLGADNFKFSVNKKVK